MLCLEFNKPNKQNVYEINSFNKFSFSQSQNNCWHTDWCRECETSKHHFLKQDKINTQPCFPMWLFPSVSGQQRAKCSSLQLKANCIAAQRCLRHYFKLIWESSNTEEKFSPSLKLLSVQTSNRMASRLTTNSKFYKECMSSLALLPPRDFAVFDRQYLLKYCTQRAKNFTAYEVSLAL